MNKTKVTLAYPYKKHEPDETVELSDDEARRLLRDGRARLPKTTPSDTPNGGSGRTTKEK